MRRKTLLALAASALAITIQPGALASQTTDTTPEATAPEPPFGVEARRPIMAAACPACVWGPFAVVTKDILQDYGYDVQICWNCNRHESPRFVADARVPHELTPSEIAINSLPPPKGPVDFGVTNERLALWLYHGIHEYADEEPRRNLRLIAHFEDPAFLITAVNAELGVTDLADIAARKLPVRIHIGNENDVLIQPILEHYGITPAQLESWGGSFVDRREAMADGVDVLITRSGSTAHNLESEIWGWAARTGEWNFLTLAPDLRESMVQELGYSHVMLPVGYLPGVTEAIPTIERSGQAVISRDDLPEEFAYTLARAMDEHRLRYLWSIRPFISDPRNVWRLEDLPLHPGAERYYRELGYMQ